MWKLNNKWTKECMHARQGATYHDLCYPHDEFTSIRGLNPLWEWQNMLRKDREKKRSFSKLKSRKLSSTLLSSCELKAFQQRLANSPDVPLPCYLIFWNINQKFNVFPHYKIGFHQVNHSEKSFLFPFNIISFPAKRRSKAGWLGARRLCLFHQEMAVKEVVSRRWISSIDSGPAQGERIPFF